MKALQDYVDQKNRWGALFGSQPLSLTKAGDRQKIADAIDSELSPENLHCDGEISAQQARKKYLYLTRVAEQLQQLDPSVKFYEFG